MLNFMELIQYGEMLTLLEEQQEMIVNRSADGLIQNLTAIHSQMVEIAKVRDKRDEQRHDLAKELDCSTDTIRRDVEEVLEPLFPIRVEKDSNIVFYSYVRHPNLPIGHSSNLSDARRSVRSVG